MKKTNKKLSAEQKARGIIFSSQLVKKNGSLGSLHEVHKNDRNAKQTIANLKATKGLDVYVENILRS